MCRNKALSTLTRFCCQRKHIDLFASKATVLMSFWLSKLKRPKTVELHVATWVEPYAHVTNTCPAIFYDPRGTYDVIVFILMRLRPSTLCVTFKSVFKSMRFGWKRSAYKCGRQALTQRNKYIFKRKRIILDGALIVMDLVVTFQRFDLKVQTFQEIDFRLIQPLNITLVKSHISASGLRLPLRPIILSCWNIIREIILAFIFFW